MSAGEALYGYDEGLYGTGYGSYVIGNARENFYGVRINGATYAAIAREGTAVYQSSAGAIDLGRAADISSNILSGFNLKAEEMGRVRAIPTRTETAMPIQKGWSLVA